VKVKMHIKKGDKVKVISGGDKGKISEIVEARASVACARALLSRARHYARTPPRHALQRATRAAAPPHARAGVPAPQRCRRSALRRMRPHRAF
jgi:hypothetical protein